MTEQAAATFSPGAWAAVLPRSVYLHVPFCHQRCPYCNFSISTAFAGLLPRYLRSLRQEIDSLPTVYPVDTLFVGGGTPSMLPLSAWKEIGSWIERSTPLVAGGEWTIEANPLDITIDNCHAWRDLGINRLSIGGQSFDDEKLRVLGRDHRGRDLEKALAVALRCFENVAIDVIFGAPGELLAGWERDLKRVLSSGVQHVSCYGLTYEKGAYFWNLRQRGALQPVAEEVELDMYRAAISHLTNGGFLHYEVSNFALPDYACRHNDTYWSLRPWLAYGPGAARFVGDTRSVNHRSTTRYVQRLEQGTSPIAEFEKLSWEQWTEERFVFGMRKIAGVDWNQLMREGAPSTVEHIRRVVQTHLEQGWLVEEGSRLRLSSAGLVVSDSLWPQYFHEP